jgi:hypothetical protein
MKNYLEERRIEDLSANHKFVFICGLHRSGTSLLFQLLREHSLVSGFHDTGVPEDEGQHLQTVFPPAKFFGGPGKFGFDKRSHLDEHSLLVSEENSNRLFTDWSRYWDLNKPILIEKSPPNLVRSRFLQALFPNSFFLLVLRHPIAVSFSTRKWTGDGIESLIEHWLVCYEQFEADKSHLKNVHTVKYEHLVANPASTLANVFQFFDLQPCESPKVIYSDTNQKHFSNWGIEEEKRTAHLEPRIQKFGYSLHLS